MPNDELNIALRTENDGDTLVFVLRGSLDLATAPTVRAALLDAIEKAHHNLIVDLCALEFLDSTGLSVLIGAHRRTAEQNGTFRLVICDGPIARLLNITGLIAVFSVYHSLDDARRNKNRIGATL
jgi:anti-sigma B factor antagonist